MTRSCRSRAIRSRSERMASRSASWRCSASSSAIAACAAKVWTISTASGASGIAPVSRPTVNTPRTSPGAPSGRMMAGPSGMCSPGRAGHPLVVAEVLQADRFTGGQHLAGHRGADREHQPEGPRRARPGRMLDDQLLAVGGGQRQRDQVGAGHFQRLLGDQGQHLIRGGAGQQPPGHLAAGAQPALLAAGLLVQLGVVDRHAGRGGQRDEQRLVLLVEVGAALLLGQVEVAVDLVPDPHRDAEEAAHRRMPGREAARLGAGRDVRQPQRARVGDQRAEQAPALRPVMDRRDLGRPPGRPGRIRSGGRLRR